jgi:hypothetical protein
MSGSIGHSDWLGLFLLAAQLPRPLGLRQAPLIIRKMVKFGKRRIIGAAISERSAQSSATVQSGKGRTA